MDTETAAQRLEALRQVLRDQNLDGCLVSMTDEYQSEYIPASDKRIAFLTGFTGSAGLVIVMQNKAAFFTDSRYTLQASKQVSPLFYEVYDSAAKLPVTWLQETAQQMVREEPIRIGFDPKLHAATSMERWEKAIKGTGVQLVEMSANPVEAIWRDRPAVPMAKIDLYSLDYAGMSSSEKRGNVAANLKENNIDAAVISDPASVAWLLNVRGGDVPHTPLPLSFAILNSDATVDWFVHAQKVPPLVMSALGPQIRFHEADLFGEALDQLGAAKLCVRMDPYSASFWIASRLAKSGASVDRGDDPCLLPKACKNDVELKGMRACHVRDGVALTKLLAWVDRHLDATELEVEAKLEELRAAHDLHRGPSFDTIAGSGAHGAIVHYRATKETDIKLETNSFLLLDSGAQYLDGTTDVTRTITIGEISDEMKDRFTRVLKGHIALASVHFPVGTTGADLDVLARQYLWEVGLDYGHGTGHGVGSYLGVHEGPQSISRHSSTPLCAGMVVSNEPGFYENNRFGIRIESLIAVVERPDLEKTSRKMLGFETITMAPIDKRAITLALLTEAEKSWLNDYHARVRATLEPLIDDSETRDWLALATEAV